MNKLIHSILFLLISLFLTSCVEINGSGYSNLTESEIQHVKKCIRGISDLQNDGILYQVTVEQVKEYIQKEHDVLVYEYLPFCSGESGQSPTKINKICNERGLKCLVISSVYDGILPIPTTNTFPMLVIDHQIYKTNNYKKYSNIFYQQLTGCDDKSRKENSYHLFNNGRYIRSIFSLTDGL